MEGGREGGRGEGGSDSKHNCHGNGAGMTSLTCLHSDLPLQQTTQNTLPSVDMKTPLKPT